MAGGGRAGGGRAGGGITDFSFLADDILVDALIMEIAALLRRFIDDGETGCIDLLGLPLAPSCLAALDRRLGQGEAQVRLDAAGHNVIRKKCGGEQGYDPPRRIVSLGPMPSS
jgi:hypothetical protein